MTSNELFHHTTKSIESFMNLNGVLRHDIINNLNIINLASDLIETGNLDPSLIDMMKISSTKLLNQLVQSRELERVLEVITEKYISEKVQAIIETTRHKHFSKCDFILNIQENFPLSTVFSSIFNGLIRNAIYQRQAKVITVTTAKFFDNLTIVISDDGKEIPNDIKTALNNKKDQFDSLKHERKFFDLFLAKEIINSMKNHQITLENNVIKGNQFMITFKESKLTS